MEGNRAIGAASFAALIATVYVANWLITTYGLVPVGFGLVAPAAVFAAGFAFTFRDILHRTLGRPAVVVAILVGATLSAFLSPQFAVASGVAFLVSEFADFAVYEPLARHSWLGALVASNVVGLVLDSMLFLWLAFGSLALLGGQIVGKAWTTLAVVAVVLITRAARALLPRHA